MADNQIDFYFDAYRVNYWESKEWTVRTNYTCIGAYIDVEGFALVRFDLVDRQFRILRTITETVPTYDKALSQIKALASEDATIDIQTIDILSNFGSTLKNHIVQNCSDDRFRVRTTPASEQKEDMILNLLNIANQNRIVPRPSDSLSLTALSELRSIDKKTLKDVYDGNKTLNSVLEAILHSIAWLESQMIKHRV
jgi:hypothetical protein